jgi:RHS repeat-associated protein
VHAVANESGAITSSFDGPYGETTATGSAFSYGYTGRRYLPDFKLYDYRNRFYDPQTGRFIHRDPIGIWGDGIGLGNGYAYVGNNPSNWIDPSGLDA